jgi:hypothetical protein
MSSKRISNADYTVPIIIATVDKSTGNYLIIDGWHRLLRAKCDGVKIIPAYCLTELETIGIFRLPEPSPCLCSWPQQ